MGPPDFDLADLILELAFLSQSFRKVQNEGGGAKGHLNTFLKTALLVCDGFPIGMSVPPYYGGTLIPIGK